MWNIFIIFFLILAFLEIYWLSWPQFQGNAPLTRFKARIVLLNSRAPPQKVRISCPALKYYARFFTTHLLYAFCRDGETIRVIRKENQEYLLWKEDLNIICFNLSFLEVVWKTASSLLLGTRDLTIPSQINFIFLSTIGRASFLTEFYEK
jgi:hypothetical protein